jgi:hypothetical protein
MVFIKEKKPSAGLENPRTSGRRKGILFTHTLTGPPNTATGSTTATATTAKRNTGRGASI